MLATAAAGFAGSLASSNAKSFRNTYAFPPSVGASNIGTYEDVIADILLGGEAQYEGRDRLFLQAIANVIIGLAG